MVEMRRKAEGSGPQITGFAGSAIRIDGMARSGGVILTPLAASDWDGGDWASAIALDPPPEFVLVGTGATLARCDPSLAAACEARGIGIEAMDSRAAARAWTLLRAEGRWISAVLMPL